MKFTITSDVEDGSDLDDEGTLARAVVRLRYPGAFAAPVSHDDVVIRTAPEASGPVGRGDTEGGAWIRAADFLGRRRQLWSLYSPDA